MENKNPLFVWLLLGWSLTVAQVAGAAAVKYTYDAKGQLIAVLYPDGTKVTYEYDSRGNRTRKLATSPAPPPPACAPAPQGMISWWTGDSGGSDLLGKNPGTLQGGAVSVAGMVGGGLAFDGVSAFLDVPDSASLGLASGVSFEAWIMPDAVQPSEFPSLFAKNWAAPPGGGDTENAANTPYGLFLNPYSGQFHFRSVGLLELVSNRTYTSIADGKFHHIAASFDGALASFYVDGKLDSSAQSYGGWMALTDGHLNLGNYAENRCQQAYSRNMTGYKGVIDEASLYARALSAEEIAAIFAAGSSGKCRP